MYHCLKYSALNIKSIRIRYANKSPTAPESQKVTK